MGIVYLAEDTELNRRVAIKTIRRSFLKRVDAVRRFLREARGGGGGSASQHHQHLSCGLERQFAVVCHGAADGRNA